jgi:hypothetical protein
MVSCGPAVVVPPAAPAASAAPAPPRAGDRVEVELLAEKTKAGGWKAKHAATGLSGPIVNAADVPAACHPGARVTLIVAAVHAGGLTFRYPTATDEAKVKDRPRGKPPPRRR